MSNIKTINTIKAALLCLGVTLTLASCNKPNTPVVANEGTIYMPRAYSTRGNLTLTLVDTAQPVTFGAAYGGLNYPSQNITVNFKIDTSLVQAYNKQNLTGYVALPQTAYAVAALTTVIHSGATTSDPLTLSVLTSKLDAGKQYMLPITLTGVSSGHVDSTLRTAYFTIDRLANVYEGAYHTTGVRHNFNADGSTTADNSIDDTRQLTTLSADSCSISTIANLGAYNGTVFYLKVNADKTVTFSGYLQNDHSVPILNTPGTTSTYDPATRTFTVHYMYTNTNGTYRHMDETWVPQ